MLASNDLPPFYSYIVINQEFVEDHCNYDKLTIVFIDYSTRITSFLLDLVFGVSCVPRVL